MTFKSIFSLDLESPRQKNLFLHIRLDSFPCPQNKLIKTTRAMTPAEALFLSGELEIIAVQLEVHFGFMYEFLQQPWTRKAYYVIM